VSEQNSRPTPDSLDEATGALREAPIPTGPPPELTAATVAAMKNRLAGSVPVEQVRRERRRRIMRYAGFTTAAAVVLGTAAFLWLGGNRAVALDKVLEKVKQAESVTFVEKQKLGDQPELEMTYSIRGPLVRVEAAGTVFVLDTKGKTGLMLISGAKAYVKIDKDSPSKIHGPAGKSPIDDLLALKDRKAESTVEEKLDGKTVQKLTIKGDPKADPPGDWVIWVDPKMELPVKMTYTGTTFAGGKQVSVTKTYEKFDWNAKLNDKLFDMKVPEGYAEGLPGQVPPPPEVLFVRAMENAEKAISLRAKITTTTGPGTKFEMKLYSQGDRFRDEMDMGKDLGGFVIIVDGKQKKGLQLNTPAKTAQWLDLSKPDKAHEAAMKDAAGLASLFADLKGKKVQALPDEAVDGRKLKVFAAKGHKLAGSKGEADVTLWIDPRTELPAKFRAELTIGDVKAVAVMEVLGWNEELDEKLFELKVPVGYKVVEEPEKK
jgi:outer membrane lipoprotein-sorting protein